MFLQKKKRKKRSERQRCPTAGKTPLVQKKKKKSFKKKKGEKNILALQKVTLQPQAVIEKTQQIQTFKTVDAGTILCSTNTSQ